MGIDRESSAFHPPGVRSPAERPVFGRDRELGQLLGALEEACSGRGSSFLLVGEPGIGKSRLADEVSRLAFERGVPTVLGRAWEAGGAPAYWPWLDVLGGLAQKADASFLQNGLGPGADRLADIVPELGARLGQPGANVAASPNQAKFELWRSATALVRHASGPRGLLLIIEDLHAADESSLQLLAFLAREVRSMRLLLLGTYRDAEASYEPAIGELITRIGREAVTLTLGRLDAQSSQGFLQERLGAVRPEVATELFEATHGNPLFLDQMARLYLEQGTEGLKAGIIPEGVREAIRCRLERVSAETRAVLEAAAVAGDDVDLGLLAAVTDQDTSAISTHVRLAAAAGVLGQKPQRARFSHALMREVLYRGLAVDRRRALHGAVGQALARLARPSDPPREAELAHHALEGPAELLPQAVDLAIRGARHALSWLAHEEAVALLERAVAAVEAGGAPPRLQAETLLALAEARIRRGEVAMGKSLCREVARLARQINDPDLLGRAALTYGEVYTFAVVDPVLVDLIEEALASLPEADSPLRVHLLARLAGALQPTRQTEEPVRVARQAIAAARRLGDERHLLRALFSAMSALMDVAPPRERLVLNLEIERLATTLGDPLALLRTHGRLIIDHTSLGEFAAADARIEAFETLADTLNAPWLAWRGPVFRSMRALVHGRFAEAGRHAERARELARRADDPQVERCLIVHRESFLRAAERHEELLAHDVACRRVRSAYFHGADWQAMGSALVATRLEDARAARFHLSMLPAADPVPTDNLYALSILAESVAYVGEPALAERLLDKIASLPEQDVMLGLTQVSWEGPTSRLLGLLEARLGRWPAARAHFDEALARLDALEARPYRARTAYEYARAFLEPSAGGPAPEPGAPDFPDVYRLLEQARAEALALDMTGLVRLCDRRLAALPARTRPAGGAVEKPPATDAASDPGAQGRLVPDGQAPPVSGSEVRLSMTAEGEVWALGFGAKTVRLKDSLGLRYLARLVAEPEREIHVLELTGASEGAQQSGDAGDAGELLDAEARQSYRERLADLRQELAEAERFGDAGRTERLRGELEFLTAELSRAVGLGGRVRRSGAAAERARSAVQRRLKNALERVAEVDPDLSAFLLRSVKTGTFCVFSPRER